MCLVLWPEVWPLLAAGPVRPVLAALVHSGLVASIGTGTVRVYDVLTMPQRDGHPTALGEAIAAYDRIFKSLHLLNRHLGVHGAYSFVLTDLAPGAIREPRDPDAPDDDEDEV